MPLWLRLPLAFTALMNLFGALLLGPLVPDLSAMFGFPAAPGLYSSIVGWFVLLFAVAYGWMAFTGVPQRGIIALGAAGKAVFGIITTYYAIIGDVPAPVGLTGLPDLVLAAVFCVYLWQSRGASSGLARE